MECGICYTDNNIVKTNCNHLFCSKCLSIWREIKNNCPNCRTTITYVVKIKKEAPNIEPRVTRSMTKPQREIDFYNYFKEIVIEITDKMTDDNRNVEEITKNINKLVKVCLKNYTLMPPNIHELILGIVKSNDYHIVNRKIIRNRLIEIKPNINYNPTIEM